MAFPWWAMRNLVITVGCGPPIGAMGAVAEALAQAAANGRALEFSPIVAIPYAILFGYLIGVVPAAAASLVTSLVSRWLTLRWRWYAAAPIIGLTVTMALGALYFRGVQSIQSFDLATAAFFGQFGALASLGCAALLDWFGYWRPTASGPGSA